MRQWKHSPQKVKCAACGVEGLRANNKDKEWVNIAGQWYCIKDACQQVAHMPFLRHKLTPHI